MMWTKIRATAGISSVALFSMVLSGCCWWAKRSCFPACDPPPPPRIVKIEVPCKLPPKLKLPAVKRGECPESIKTWVCYAPAEAGKLAMRLASMKDWILEVRRRCSPRPASQPTSQPTN